MMQAGGRRRVLVLAFEEAQLLDIAGPSQVFATATELLGGTGYRLDVASRNGGLVRTSAGLAVGTVQLPAATTGIDTVIVVGGPGIERARCDRALLEWLACTAPRVRRVASVCTGAFVLAAAGLLDGRRVTTHWASCARLQSLHPETRVDADPIFVRDGSLWTSAGVTAGIDLALAMVEEDFGRPLALDVARRLVVFLKRPGGQAQFSAPLAAQLAATRADEDARLAALQAWIAGNLGEDLRVERLAERAGMSPRSFARVFVAKTGTTPAKLVEELRLEAARRALEETASPVKHVAVACGFGDEERMRRAFLRRLGVSPLDYRRRFSTETSAASGIRAGGRRVGEAGARDQDRGVGRDRRSAGA